MFATRFRSLCTTKPLLRTSTQTLARCFSASGDRQCVVEYLDGDDAGVTLITLCRPEGRNSLSRQMLAEFRQAIETVNYDGRTRVAILHSTVPRVFCAGADLKERAKMNQIEVSQFVGQLRSAFCELEEVQVPTIACIEGAALGGGLEMALSCDMRVAGDNATLGLVETALAIIPGAGGTQRLPRVVGSSRAKELIFTAEKLAAKRAEEIGLVNYATGAGGAMEKSIEIARKILPNGPVAVKAAKIAVDTGMQCDRRTGMSVEQQCYARVIPTSDRLEGLQAFKEKRRPVYKGE